MPATSDRETYEENSPVAARTLLGQRVTLIIDRPLGRRHPRHPDIVYPINYGYVPDILAGKG